MTYTVFRNSRLPDFYCAVPQGRPVPPFVREPVWAYECITTPDKPRPRGFSDEVARFACTFQGFYTFRERPILERRLNRAPSASERDPTTGRED
jgi:hypothetical protein